MYEVEVKGSNIYKNKHTHKQAEKYIEDEKVCHRVVLSLKTKATLCARGECAECKLEDLKLHKSNKLI